MKRVFILLINILLLSQLNFAQNAVFILVDKSSSYKNDIVRAEAGAIVKSLILGEYISSNYVGWKPNRIRDKKIH